MILQSVLRIWLRDVIGRVPVLRDHIGQTFFLGRLCRFQRTIKTPNGVLEPPLTHNTQIRSCFRSMVYLSAEPIFVWPVFPARFVALPTLRHSIRTTAIRHTILSRLQTKRALMYPACSFSNMPVELSASSNPSPSHESLRELKHGPIPHYGILLLSLNWNMSNRR